MEFEFDSIGMDDSPPSSPILGYSGGDDEQSVIEAGVVYCLSCKGPPRPTDHSFSPESYILRREVISALENLNSNPLTNGNLGGKSRLVKCFDGRLFDPLEKNQVKLMVQLSRKNITSLEILSEHPFLLTPGMGTISKGTNIPSCSEDSQDLSSQDPWLLRKNVCIFLNYIVRQLKYYRLAWRKDNFDEVFLGLKRSLEPVKDWSATLKSQCGFRSGNECTSASYHYFHLQLEVRWSLLLIFGLQPSIIQWLLDDLVHLAYSNYSRKDGNVIVSLEAKQPFNCVCVKEIWTMMFLLVQELKPQDKTFWSFYTEAMQRSSKDVYFPIWLTAHLSSVTKYSPAGVYNPSQIRPESNGYDYLRGAFREWGNRGGKSGEVLRLSFRIFQNWGGDFEIIQALWNQWTPRLDSSEKGFLGDSFRVGFCQSVDQWLRLIFKLCPEDSPGQNYYDRGGGNGVGGGGEEYLNKDPFNEFVCLAVAYASSCLEEKDVRRLKSNIFMKLSRCNTNDFSEHGINRVATYLLCLISAVKFDTEAISLAQRLHELFQYAKFKDTSDRKKAVFRIYSTCIILLLRRGIKVTDSKFSSIAYSYVKIVDELLAQPSSSSPLRKDLVIVYLNFLECLPPYTPALSKETNLGRNELIGANFLMFLSQCDANYAVRMLRTLGLIMDWVVQWVKSSLEYEYGLHNVSAISSTEAKDLFGIMKEKCFPFLKSSAMSSSNRVIPRTDLEPLAQLAGDVTYLTRKFMEGSKAKEECSEHFELFAMNLRCCPLVSQYYVERLLGYKEFREELEETMEGGVVGQGQYLPKWKWTQVWLRLIFLNCQAPDDLTLLILGPSFVTTSNEELLLSFTSKWRSDGGWSTDQVNKAISPLVPLLKGIMDGSFIRDNSSSQASGGSEAGAILINSVIRSCTLLLRKFEVLYEKGLMTSCGHEFLNCLVPPSWIGVPPWEKFSQGVMASLEANIYDIFKAVLAHPGVAGKDPFLLRKMQDIVVFTFFGFVKEKDTVLNKEHPLVTIFNYCEDHEVNLVQEHILPEVIAGDITVKDSRYRHQFLKVAHIFWIKKFTTLVIRVLHGVIRCYCFCAKGEEKVSQRRCIDVVYYACMFGATPLFQKQVIQAFTTAFDKDFDFKGLILLDLCLVVAKRAHSEQVSGGTGVKNANHVKDFMRHQVLHLLEKFIQQAEAKRAAGEDRSLRNRLRELKSLVSQ